MMIFFSEQCVGTIQWDEKRSQKLWECCIIWYINMVDMIRETYKRNGAKTILDGDKRIWVNEKYIEERLHNTLLKI